MKANNPALALYMVSLDAVSFAEQIALKQKRSLAGVMLLAITRSFASAAELYYGTTKDEKSRPKTREKR